MGLKAGSPRWLHGSKSCSAVHWLHFSKLLTGQGSGLIRKWELLLIKFLQESVSQQSFPVRGCQFTSQGESELMTGGEHWQHWHDCREGSVRFQSSSSPTHVILIRTHVPTIHPVTLSQLLYNNKFAYKFQPILFNSMASLFDIVVYKYLENTQG